MDGKRYSPAQLAHMSGVSVRTLHHYDQIGLLVPERRTNGYRSYSSADAERLQQILILKRCGVELADIGRILDSPAFDARTALRAHLAELKRKRAELDALITTVEQTLDHLEKGTAMADEQRFEGLKARTVEENERVHGAEVRGRWGDGVADAANDKLLAMDEEAWNDMEALTESVLEQLRTAMATCDPMGAEAEKLVRMHARWLEMHWPEGTYTPEAHRGMGQMYVADERFRAYYDGPCGEGAAQFLCDAIGLLA
ncbi:MAG: MerR family transcriptional regulator [Atopobiaceae bacterium]|nr:MerR family transcriptional regulator [Atopobiaceae bacterium]